MKKQFILIFFEFITALCYGDNSNQLFVDRFPLVEYQELDSILFLRDSRTLENQKCVDRLSFLIDFLQLHKEDTLNTDVANSNMWFEHRNILQPVDFRGYPDSVSPPLVINDMDGKFYTPPTGCMGIFTKVSEDLKFGGCYVYPMARLEFPNFYMLVICREFYNPDTYKTQYEGEAYTYNKKNDEMLSSLCVFSLNAGIFSNIKNVTFRQDSSLVYYEYIPDPEEEDPTPNVIQYRTIYKLDKDGYFHKTRPYVRRDSWQDVAFVNDPDGYVNVRSKPNAKSEILYRVKDKSLVRVDKVKGSKWGEVLYAKEPFGGDKFISGGFVYLPKLKWFKSKTPDFFNNINGDGDY